MVPKQVAFTCRICHRDYGDPLYTGPLGHCTPDVCLDCWSYHWTASTRRHLPIGIKFLLENYRHNEIHAKGLTRYELDRQINNFDVEEVSSAEEAVFVCIPGEDYD